MISHDLLDVGLIVTISKVSKKRTVVETTAKTARGGQEPQQFEVELESAAGTLPISTMFSTEKDARQALMLAAAVLRYARPLKVVGTRTEPGAENGDDVFGAGDEETPEGGDDAETPPSSATSERGTMVSSRFAERAGARGTATRPGRGGGGRRRAAAAAPAVIPQRGNTLQTM